MRKSIKVFFLIITAVFSNSVFSAVQLSRDIYKEVPFSYQYSNDGAMIRNIDFKAVNDLIPQLEKQFANLLKGQKLQDRNEAHITVITPPEGKTDFFPGSIGIDKVLPTADMLKAYKDIMQVTYFQAVCVGMQSNTKGNIVFYLVVESEDILDIRNEIYELTKQSQIEIPFHPTANYDPHITIGYIGGDVHGVSKGKETCVADLQFI